MDKNESESESESEKEEDKKKRKESTDILRARVSERVTDDGMHHVELHFEMNEDYLVGGSEGRSEGLYEASSESAIKKEDVGDLRGLRGDVFRNARSIVYELLQAIGASQRNREPLDGDHSYVGMDAGSGSGVRSVTFGAGEDRVNDYLVNCPKCQYPMPDVAGDVNYCCRCGEPFPDVDEADDDEDEEA